MNQFSTRFFGFVIAGLLLVEPAILSAQEPGGAPASEPSVQQPSSSDSTKSDSELPESPGATQVREDSTSAPVPSPSTQAQTETQPGGTAAAPAIPVSGNAVSRPAGVAVAPPKQRQSRSFLIKLGLIAGAGVALGSVAALSMSSPARVPGSTH
jgi:cytoskeletal protein RodZ